MIIRKYNRQTDEEPLMKMIEEEDGWDYAEESMAEKYRKALAASVTYVAIDGGVLCGYSRSLDDCGFYIYVCDLLVKPAYRGKDTGRKLMEYLYQDYPDHVVYVMSDVDGYYSRVNYNRIGSVFEVPRGGE